MRLLVECPDCQRQYDASRREIGSRFRCHCGEVVEVRRPEGHDARVTRCSACGAGRSDGAPGCAYCGAEFTLHERDLNTVCPHCLARVADRARFCHHCGTGLVPELDAGTDTDVVCPACQDGRRLVSRPLGAEASVLECGRCAGFWMGHEAFRLQVELAKGGALPEGTTPEAPRDAARRAALPPRPDDPGPEGSFYRPCAVCGAQMNRRHYGPGSGVIVDICREHGVWFDADEQARILAWIRAGGGQSPRADRAAAGRAAEAILRHERHGRSQRTFVDSVLDWLGLAD